MRISTNIVLFLVLMNATSGFLVATGVANDLGIAPLAGGSEQVESVNGAAKDVSPGGGAGGTLFGLFVSAAGTIKDILVMATVGGPLILANAGLPAALVGLLFAPMYVIVGADLLYAYTGRDV